MAFRGLCRFEKNYRVLYRGGSSQMITVDYIGGGRTKKNFINDYIILEQPLSFANTTLFIIWLNSKPLP